MKLDVLKVNSLLENHLKLLKNEENDVSREIMNMSVTQDNTETNAKDAFNAIDKLIKRVANSGLITVNPEKPRFFGLYKKSASVEINEYQRDKILGELEQIPDILKRHGISIIDPDYSLSVYMDGVRVECVETKFGHQYRGSNMSYIKHDIVTHQDINVWVGFQHNLGIFSKSDGIKNTMLSLERELKAISQEMVRAKELLKTLELVNEMSVELNELDENYIISLNKSM